MRYKYLRFRFLYHGTVSSFAISVTIGSEASVSFVAGLRKSMVMVSMNVGVDKPPLVKEIGRLLNFAERGPARRGLISNQITLMANTMTSYNSAKHDQIPQWRAHISWTLGY